jgi:small GTP-binding protein
MGIFKKLFSSFGSKDCQILMLGLDNSGKTTILYKLKIADVLTTIPTIGFNIEEIRYKKLCMKVWDVGGQDRIRLLWHHYFEQASALIFVVDSSDERRLKEARDELHNILKTKEMSNKPVLIYNNKSDLNNSLPADHVIDDLNLPSLDQPWLIQDCSAYEGVGLYEGLEWLNKKLC